MVIPAVILFGIATLMSKKGHSNLAGLLLIATVSLVILYFGVVLGDKSGAQYMYFAMSALPIAFFNKKHRIYFGLGIAFPIVCFFILIWVLFGMIPPLVVAPIYFKFLQLFIAATSFTIIFGSHSVFFSMVTDSEENLIKNNEVLNQSNTTLVATLNRLEKSNALVQSLAQQATLGAIIRGITHEVKGPLTAIQACCSVILLSHNPSPEIKENVEDMLECILHLGELTKTLLADSGAVVWADSPLNLYRIIDQVIKLVDNEAFTNKIVIEKEIPHEFPMVKGSAAYVSQAILNLLLNALQYTPRNGKIKVWIGIEEDYVKIYVRDSGPGIDPLVKETLFEHGVTTAKPGSSNVGLGLHFVKRVMDAHKGFISVHESSEKGTTFVMVLPIEKESVQAIR